VRGGECERRTRDGGERRRDAARREFCGKKRMRKGRGRGRTRRGTRSEGEVEFSRREASESTGGRRP